MNKDLQNKIERLRGLLSSQSQIAPTPPNLPEGAFPMIPEASPEGAFPPGENEDGDDMTEGCLGHKLENGSNAICPPEVEDGACCFGGSCTPALMESDCIAWGGTFLGAGTTCEGDPCGGGMTLSIRDIFIRGLDAIKEEGEVAPDVGVEPPIDPTMMR